MPFKRLMKANWIMSIFSRLLLTFLFITAPLYVLSIEIYQWAVQTQKQAISNTMLSQVNFYLDRLEKEMERIKVLQYYSTSNVNLQQLALVPGSYDDYERVQLVTQLQQHLQSVASSSSYIKSVNAYIPAINRVVSSLAYESSIPEEEFSFLAANAERTLSTHLLFWNGRLFLNASSHWTPAPVDGGSGPEQQRPAYVIAVELNLKELESALQQFNDYEDGGAVLVDLNEAFKLTSTGSTEENESVFERMEQTVTTDKSGTGSVQANDRTYWMVYARSDDLDVALSKYMPESAVMKTLEKYVQWFWLFTATATLLIVLYSVFTYRMIYKPVSQLVKSFRKIEKGDLDLTITYKTDNEFRYLYGAFNRMVHRLKDTIDQIYKQKILAQHAQLKQLQTQIVPHFLYNSYFILHRMILDEDHEHAARFSQQLGHYLKFITRSGEDEVLLGREIEHARIYTEILSMRFASRMRLEFASTPDGCSAIVIPRLIIQPIIENSIEHGLENKASDGVLLISFEESEKAWDVIVEDNGNGLNDRQLEELQLSLIETEQLDEVETTGVKNIHRRLQYKFGKDSGLHFSRSALGGLKTVIRIGKEAGHVQALDR